ncbi:unnamed protein product [Durusdinium trenchii]|uniref:Tyr recombinase domain-containing protein n=1 Tax=Durusdinium trenchii TaxID=1381693 RepID=A0ABP0RJN8_9DINO
MAEPDQGGEAPLLHAGLEVFSQVLQQTATLGELGCALGWLLARISTCTDFEFDKMVIRTVYERCCRPQIASSRGAIFPLPLGALDACEDALRTASLADVVTPHFVERWQADAWQFCVGVGLNAIGGKLQPQARGSTNKLQARAAAASRAAVERFLGLGGRSSRSPDEIRGDADFQKGQDLHNLVEDVWARTGLVSSAKKRVSGNIGTVPILVISLFNGIGGCFRVYDVLDIRPLGMIAVELHKPAIRIVERRWPQSKTVPDVRLVDAALVKQWHLEYPMTEEANGHRTRVQSTFKEPKRRGIVLKDSLVKPKTLQQYYKYARKLLPIIRQAHDEHELDELLSEHLEDMWRTGRPLYHASAGLCGLHFFMPWSKGKLPQTWRIFRIWRRLEVPCRAPPLPRELLQAFAGKAIARGDLVFGALLLTGFDGLLRTGELLALTGADFLIRNDIGLVRLADTKTSNAKGISEVVTLKNEWTLMVLDTLQEYLRENSLLHARCQIGGVLIRSGTVRRRDEAEDLLVHLRHAHALSGNLEERLLAATEALSALGKSVTFAVVTLDARRWVGQTLESPSSRLAEVSGYFVWGFFVLKSAKQRPQRPQAGQASGSFGWMLGAVIVDSEAETVQRLARRGDAAETRKRLRQEAAGRRLERSYLWAKKRAERLLERAMEPRLVVPIAAG